MKQSGMKLLAGLLALCLLLTGCGGDNGTKGPDPTNTTPVATEDSTITDGTDGPVDPTAPIDPSDPSDPSVTSDPSDPTLSTEPIDPADPTAPVGSTGTGGTTDPIRTTSRGEVTKTSRTKGPTATAPTGGSKTSGTKTPATTKKPTGTTTIAKNKHNCTLTETELKDKLLGSWIGQMVGVALFAKTEFGSQGKIMAQAKVDVALNEWNQGILSINDAFGQDDLYVEIPFMETMEQHGAFCSVEKMADTFKRSTFPLWHANLAARTNLLAGIEYPDSGHYLYNKHADDIDWQIECDFLGAMYPGMVNTAAQRSFEIGHIMNYGDGVYGGVFVTAMHAAAYTADSVDEVVEAGLAVIPDGTLFKDAMNLVMKSHAAGDTWEQCWQKLENTVAPTDLCPDLCKSAGNIDAKLNAAYILVGLLWGEGDFEKTMIISGRCGQDSDCNPSSAASILGNLYGASRIPEKYKKGLDDTNRKFATTKYTLKETVELNLALAEQVLTAAGATKKNGVWSLAKDTKYQAVAYEQWDGSTFDAALNVTNEGNGVVKLSLDTIGDEAIRSVTMDMGDGFVAHGNLAYYNYAKAGEYTVTYTVVGSKGTTITRKRRVQVQPIIKGVKPICTVTLPTGGGSKNMSTMYDGVIPYITDSSSALQYDTYDGGKARSSVYAGLQFDKTYTLERVDFTEGLHFHDGGWFVGRPQVEVLVDGKWQEAQTTISVPYPTGTAQSDFGNPFETYVFTFKKPTACQGVRLVGKPGGTAHFISVGEITPIPTASSGETFTDNRFPLVICDETNPTGSGNRDLRIITDGKTGTKGADQYVTFDGTGKSSTEYVGILYRADKKVSKITFTEGGYLNSGGWFKNGIRVEVLVGGKWKQVSCKVSPTYPIGNSKAVFGDDGETFVFTLNTPITCQGVRLIGESGGSAAFISISELTVA